MEKFQAVLLNVWREACRHIEISQSTEQIAALLVREMPIGQVLVRIIDPERSCLETLAVGPIIREHDTLESRSECSDAQIKRLLAWCRKGKIVCVDGHSAATPDLEAVVPPGVDADVLAGPLGDRAAGWGVLVFVATPGNSFNARHQALMEVLLEPFSVALEHDRQLREVEMLREAAEADKRSLLSRLGREKLEDTIIGAESGLHAVMERVELVARSDVPVLVIGETGTGKELLARAIHNRSARASGPVCRVNCGAIPSELIDSQLFGHERGAFTGASEMRKGWFERADGGTLFLDEVAELPLAAQVRLLRILQDGWLERVGAQHPIHVDVRIVAATHRDLADMVTERVFREDLWYRIAVFPILLPALRERCEDIAELAAHFARRASRRFGLPPAMPSPQDIRLLVSYDWPGNVRELGTVIDRAAILGKGKRLEVAEALGVATGPGRRALEGEASLAAEVRPAADFASLDTAIKNHIETALAQTMGRVEGPRGAATLLQINPHTLRARMRKLGIDWNQFRQPGSS